MIHQAHKIIVNCFQPKSDENKGAEGALVPPPSFSEISKWHPFMLQKSVENAPFSEFFTKAFSFIELCPTITGT